MKKKLQLVLLSTDKATNLILDKGKLEFISNKQVANTINSACKGFNLHAISDEKPKIGDYVYNSALNVIEKFTEFDNGLLQNKIVITTNESLKTEDECKIRSGKMVGYYPTEKELLIFTNDFLDTYIKKYNDGEVLEFVEVDYKSMTVGCDEKDTFSTGFKCKDKSGNTVKGCFCSSPFKGVTIRFE